MRHLKGSALKVEALDCRKLVDFYAGYRASGRRSRIEAGTYHNKAPVENHMGRFIAQKNS